MLLDSALSVAMQSVRFTVALPEQSALKLRGGVANGLVQEAANGARTPLVTSVQPGATLTSVALFIDSNKAALHSAAITEYWCARFTCWGMHQHACSCAHAWLGSRSCMHCAPCGKRW